MRQPGSLRALSRSAGHLLPSFSTPIYLYQFNLASPRTVKGVICDAVLVSRHSMLSLYDVSLNDLLLPTTHINTDNLCPYFHLCSGKCLLSSPFIVWVFMWRVFARCRMGSGIFSHTKHDQEIQVGRLLGDSYAQWMLFLPGLLNPTGLTNDSMVTTLIRYDDAVAPPPGELSVIFWMLSRSDRLCFL